MPDKRQTERDLCEQGLLLDCPFYGINPTDNQLKSIRTFTVFELRMISGFLAKAHANGYAQGVTPPAPAP